MLLCTSAESLYWFARQIERADALSRALLTYEELGLDMPKSLVPHGSQLLSTLGLSWVTSPSRFSALKASWVLDAKNPSSVLGALQVARENLRTSRAFVPAPIWEALNAFYLELEASSQNLSLSELLVALSRVELLCNQLRGQLAAGMTRDDAYTFLDIGWHLERADMLLRLVSVSSELVMPDDPRPFDDVRWAGLLKSVGAFEMYRRRHHARLDLGRILEFLLLAPNFPRGLAYCVKRLERALETLPRSGPALSALSRVRPDASLSSQRRPVGTMIARASAALEPLAALNSVLDQTYFASQAQLAPARQFAV